MKNPFSIIIMLACAFMLISCRSSNLENKQNLEEVATLLQRHQKLQLNNEWTIVQNKYAALSEAIRKDPSDVRSTIQLAHLFIQEARVTGEHGHYYPAALQVLNAALEQSDEKGLTSDERFMALSLQAGVHLSLHNFTKALEIGREALSLNNHNAQIYGVLVDANVELGHYEQAVARADQMVSIRPDLRSYARISYLREIHGDIDGAIEAMEMAVSAGFPLYEETAWAKLTLGELYQRYDLITKAEVTYASILQDRPGYPFAIAALADLAKGAQNYIKAESLLDEACNIIPEVGFYTSKAEILLQTARKEEAHQILSEVFLMLEDDVRSGHNMDLEYAHIYADLLNQPEKALVFLQKEYSDRPANINVNKKLASVYLQLNDVENAKKHLQLAQKTQSTDPELLSMRSELISMESEVI